ncbi:MAG: hypothetical protein ACNA8W_19055, partial [Bradymonadaceae bacterium]
MTIAHFSAVALSLTIAGCTHTPWGRAMYATCPGDEISSEELFAAARDDARRWLRLVPFEPSSHDGALAILSYPGGPEEISGRTYVYDQALALLWFTWIGEPSRAQG